MASELCRYWPCFLLEQLDLVGVQRMGVLLELTPLDIVCSPKGELGPGSGRSWRRDHSLDVPAGPRGAVRDASLAPTPGGAQAGPTGAVELLGSAPRHRCPGAKHGSHHGGERALVVACGVAHRQGWRDESRGTQLARRAR